MKKYIFPIIASSACGLATAQSSVSIFGTIDIGITHLSGSESSSKTSMSNSGANINRLGFRGKEDLGNQWSAEFWLEGGLNPDTGTGKASDGGFNFNRRSTVSLVGPIGEFRFGRDNAASYLSTLIFDPFLTNGVGGTMSFAMNGAPIQISNAVSYILPPGLGGFYGQFQYALGEATSTSTTGDYASTRLGYQKGALNTALSFGRLAGKNGTANLLISNAALNYDFGVVRPSLLLASEKKGTATIRAVQAGLTAPLGPGSLRMQVSRYTTSHSSADWTKYAIGYGYDLSKRTQIYGAIARVSNDSGAQKALRIFGATSVGTTLGGNSTGYDIGIRHFF